jgi:hypothetical protein
MTPMATPEEDLLLVLKSAEKTGDDEHKSTNIGETQLYPDPDVRTRTAKPAMGAPWGEDEMTNPLQFSDTVKSEHQAVRRGTIERALNSKLLSDKAEQQLIGDLLDHGSSGDFESHSVHLQGKGPTKLAYPREGTLAERVARATGRH